MGFILRWKEIHFGGKQLVIWGNNATLDAQQKGRFFSSTAGPNDDDDHAPAGKTSLELHDLVLQNGQLMQQGDYASLANSDGAFRTLMQQQGV